MSAVLHELEVRVYYEDTDAAGIVYHANYLRFAERARTELLRRRGLDHRTLAERYGLLFAVANCSVAYRSPARLDDSLTVRTSLTRLGGASVQLRQDVVRGADLIATLDVRLAIVDLGLRPARLPAALEDVFRSN